MWIPHNPHHQLIHTSVPRQWFHIALVMIMMTNNDYMNNINSAVYMAGEVFDDSDGHTLPLTSLLSEPHKLLYSQFTAYNYGDLHTSFMFIGPLICGMQCSLEPEQRCIVIYLCILKL